MSVTDADPKQPAGRAAAASDGSPVRRGSAKLTEKHFTPRSFRLASLGKSYARQSIALNDAFPDDKESFLWESLHKSAANDGKLAEVIRRAVENDREKEKLIKYVRTALCLFVI